MSKPDHFLLLRTLFWLLISTTSALADEIKLADAHIHYSHDAWNYLPLEQAVDVLRQAGLRYAFVSSSSDEGTQKLYDLAPELVVPVLRPYRKRGELGSWMHDESVPGMLEALLERNWYAGIGEFHAFNTDIELPVLQQVIALAKRYGIFLHAHSDADAVERIFRSDPEALVLWAHSGFDSPAEIAAMLEKYPNLWADLAFRYEHATDDAVNPEWRALFEQFPDRFMLGTDTYTPERWYFVIEHADDARAWLSTLPQTVAEGIAYRNAESLLKRVKR